MRELAVGVLDDLGPSLAAHHVERFCARATALDCPRHALVYRQGEPAEHVYLLLEGEVQSALLGASGKESLLRIHLAGSILGLTALASAPWRDATAKAIAPSRLARIHRDDLKELIRSDSDLGLALIQLLVDRMRDFHFRVGVVQGQSVEQRLARVLLALARRQAAAPDGATDIHLTHEELAQLVNARRPTVTAVLSRFAETGLIAREGRRVVVKDWQGLAALVSD